MLRRWLMSCLVVGALLLGSCSPDQTTTAPAPESPQATEAPTSTTDPFADLPRLDGEATVALVVDGSPITIRVDGANAPITAGNFVDLVQRGVYDGTIFHRVVREPEPFVVQGGDPQSTDPNVPTERLGTGSFVDPTTGNPRYIPLEIKPQGATAPEYSRTLDQAPQLRHTRGAVAMARSGMPDSASAQFYITLADLSFLDGSYAVFGYVTDGMEVVDQIQQGDRLESARVVAGAENLTTGGGTPPSPTN